MRQQFVLANDNAEIHQQFVSANDNAVLEAEVRTLQRRLQRRDTDLLKQERELHKLRVNIYIFLS